MKKNLFWLAGVLFGILALLFFCTKLLTPTWFDWNTDNTMKGIYIEPDNRIQVLFLGSSSIITGISPISLYNNYGICAYNMGTPEQPLLSSYYWLKEIHRHHSETLNTVVLDSYFIFNQDPPFERNERALTHMRLSPVKIEAFTDLSTHYDNFKVWTYLFPVLAYHSRWMEVNEDDFDGLTNKNNYFYTRGQYPSYSMALKGTDPSKMAVPVYGISKESNYTPDEYQKVWGEENRVYFKKIVEFCKENHLNLVLTALLYPGYWDLEHDALQYLAEINNIPFLDFNLVELQNEAGLKFAYDYWNPTHPNVLGAEKISNYIGDYLNKIFKIKDIRGNNKYDYLAGYSENYSPVDLGRKLMSCDQLDQYLTLLDNDRYTIFISVKGEASAGLSDELRMRFSELGFSNFAAIKEGLSYVGMKNRGQIIVDSLGKDPQQIIIAQGSIAKDNIYMLSNVYARESSEGHFAMGDKKGMFSLVSAGESAGNFSEMKIDGVERSENNNGINFVVYDNELKEFIVSGTFDTSVEKCIRSDLLLPEIYKKRLNNALAEAEKN